MKKTDFDRQIKAFEERHNDDLELLNALGPHQFPTNELLELKGRIDEKLRAFDFYHRRIVWLGASAVVWLAVGGVFLAVGWGGWARGAFFLLPCTLAAFLGGTFFLKKEFDSRGHWVGLQNEILAELKKRRARVAN